MATLIHAIQDSHCKNQLLCVAIQHTIKLCNIVGKNVLENNKSRNVILLVA